MTCTLLLFISLSCCVLHGVAADVMSIEYFGNAICDSANDLYGMQVQVAQCFRQVGSQGNGSAMVSCTSGVTGELVVYEYAGSVDCSSGISSVVTLAAGFSDTSCLTTPFNSNEYFPTISSSSNSVKINCAAAVEWFTADDGRYELSRQTTSLESRSALDYTKDNCVQNSLTTEMAYCYLNRDGVDCLPTNSDANDDSFCSASALTTFAYSSSCLSDNYNSNFVQYWSDNNKAGYMNPNCNAVWDDQVSYVMPYSDCLGCNRFKDLKDESADTSAIVAILIAVGIAVAVCCGIGCIWFLFVTFGVTAWCCKKKKRHDEANTRTLDAVITTPLHPSGPAPGVSMSHSPMWGAGGEVLDVCVPQGAGPGTVLMATTSTGQQVQVVVPDGVLPGQIIRYQV